MPAKVFPTSLAGQLAGGTPKGLGIPLPSGATLPSTFGPPEFVDDPALPLANPPLASEPGPEVPPLEAVMAPALPFAPFGTPALPAPDSVLTPSGVRFVDVDEHVTTTNESGRKRLSARLSCPFILARAVERSTQGISVRPPSIL
jgi:hypothetical protein